jgi:hypothetical protein
VSKSAAQASEVVRAAWSAYRAKANPDLRLLDLDKVVALIEAGFPFCESCSSSTTEDSPGNTNLYNGIGTSLRPRKERCPKCHSVLAKKWVVVLLIPIFL